MIASSSVLSAAERVQTLLYARDVARLYGRLKEDEARIAELQRALAELESALARVRLEGPRPPT